MNVAAVEREIAEAPTINPAALIVLQGEALRNLEKARKRSEATLGKPGPIQWIVERQLFYAIAQADELDALTLEAF